MPYSQETESEHPMTITRAGFIIIETETIPFNPTDASNYIVGRFAAAKKLPGSFGEKDA